MDRTSQYKVVRVLQELAGYENLTEEDVRNITRTTGRESYDLHAVVTSKAYERFNELSQSPERARMFCELVLEALHQGLDGWDDGDCMVIELFLQDVLIALDHS